jgi:hypothetical protein
MADKLSIEAVVRLLIEKRPDNEEMMWGWLEAYVHYVDGAEPDGVYDGELPYMLEFLDAEGANATD